MDPAGKSSAPLSAALCSRKRIPKGWIASSISSTFSFLELYTIPSEYPNETYSTNIHVNASSLLTPNNRNMQDCFRRHPETYGSEMDDDDDRYEGDTEPPSYPIDDSANSPSSPGDTPTPPNDQTDQRTENNPPSPQSASPHPQVDEPSIYPQPPLDPPQPSSSSALQPASPAHERNRESEPIAAPNSLSDAEQSKIDLRN